METKKIDPGYRDLNEHEVEFMQRIKTLGRRCEELEKELQDAGYELPELDPRWMAIGKTHFQQGLMAWTRAVARPNFF